MDTALGEPEGLEYARATLWAIALLAIASVLLFQGYGALGLAYATLIAYGLHTIWQGLYLIAILKRKDSQPSTIENQLNTREDRVD